MRADIRQEMEVLLQETKAIAAKLKKRKIYIRKGYIRGIEVTVRVRKMPRNTYAKKASKRYKSGMRCDWYIKGRYTSRDRIEEIIYKGKRVAI